MKRIIIYAFLLIMPLGAWGQMETIGANFECDPELDCFNGIDEDGDGFVDCEDLDCYLANLRKAIATNARSNAECTPINEGECILENINFINELEIKSVPDAQIVCQKINELSSIIAEDPWAFLEDCLNDPDNPIPDWEDLASFEPGPEIIETLKNRSNGEWEIQKLDDADGAILNVDYFAVAFDNLPGNMSAEELFNTIRAKFQILGSSCSNDFDFHNKFIDEDLWASNNPAGTIFDINIFGPDNGAVIVSQFDNSPNECLCWTFTTITNTTVGEHPVSGNRQFGLFQNEVGQWIFYTRGVDRAIDNAPFSINSRIGFFMADTLWDCLMEEVQDLVDPQKGNSSTFNHSFRPNWDEIKDKILALPVSELLDCLQSN